jgi:hypothetical protein
MADVGDQRPSYDSPTTPFRKIVLPAEETIRISRPPAPGPSSPIKPPNQAPGQPSGQPSGRPSNQPPAQPQKQPPSQPNQQSQPQNQNQNQSPNQEPPRQPPVWPPANFPVSGNQGQQRTQPPPHHPLPIPPKPPARRLGDIPIKAVYLLGAILGTVLAVALIFVLFSGDVPANKQSTETVVPVAPVPSASVSASASPSPTVSESPIVLPPVPESKKFPTLSGTASLVSGLITDKTVGITYPRLASPWKAKSFPPFSIAQRIGKVAIPHTVIASAMFPGDSPTKKPTTNADYREIASQAARWAMRTQYPKGATLAWTGSQKNPLGKGWTLGFKVTFTSGGKQQVAQAVVTVVEVGKTKPGMLMASIPESNKTRWPDLNTLVKQVRPL